MPRVLQTFVYPPFKCSAASGPRAGNFRGVVAPSQKTRHLSPVFGGPNQRKRVPQSSVGILTPSGRIAMTFAQGHSRDCICILPDSYAFHTFFLSWSGSNWDGVVASCRKRASSSPDGEKGFQVNVSDPFCWSNLFTSSTSTSRTSGSIY